MFRKLNHYVFDDILLSNLFQKFFFSANSDIAEGKLGTLETDMMFYTDFGCYLCWHFKA